MIQYLFGIEVILPKHRSIKLDLFFIQKSVLATVGSQHCPYVAPTIKYCSVYAVGDANYNLCSQQTQVLQHPAPFPETAPQQIVGGAKNMPPMPTLKLNHKNNSE